MNAEERLLAGAGRRSADRASGRRQQVAVDVRRRRRSRRRRRPTGGLRRRAARRLTRPPLDVDGDDVGAEPGRRPAARSTAPADRGAQPAQPALDVPCAERLLDIGDDREGGRSTARVGPGVGGVAVEEHPLPRVGEIAGEPRYATRSRGDRSQVAQPSERRSSRAGPVERLTRGTARAWPARPQAAWSTAPVQPAPAPARRRRPWPAALPASTGPVCRARRRQRSGSGTAGRPARGRRCPRERRPRDDGGLQEQVAVDRGQRQQRRPGVEDEPFAHASGRACRRRSGACSSTVTRCPCAASRAANGQAAHARADDDHPAHRQRRPFQVSVPARCPRTDAAVSAAEDRDGGRVREAVRPDPATDAAGDERPAGDARGVADRPGAGPAQGSERPAARRPRTARPLTADRTRRGPERGPQGLAVAGAQSACQPSYIRQVGQGVPSTTRRARRHA